MKITKVFTGLTALSSILLLSACGGEALDRRPDPTDTFYNQDTALSVDNQLVVAAGQIQQSLKELNLTNAAAGSPKADAVDVASLPQALQHEITSINYTGPADNLILQLANIAGYRFIAPLHAPTVPVMANITSERTTVGEALQDVGLQIQHQASIIVNPSAQTITLRYDDLGQYVSREESLSHKKVTGFTTKTTTIHHHKHKISKTVENVSIDGGGIHRQIRGDCK